MSALAPVSSPTPASLDQRLRRASADSLAADELLALASGLPGDACHRLVEEAGGLVPLSRLLPDELARTGGVSWLRAARLAAAFELGRRLAAEAAAQSGWQVRTPADVAERLLPTMRHLEREELRVLLLSTKNVVIGGATVYAGNLAGSSVRVGEVFRDAVRRQAAAIVVVHNHPSGDPAPSGEDLRITAELAEAGRLLDIELVDHLVVADRGWVSLRAMGRLRPQPSATIR